MKLVKMMKVQLYIMLCKRSFRISFTILLLYALGIYLINVFSNLNNDVSATLAASNLFLLNQYGTGYRYLALLFPFIVLFPYSFSYLNDKTTKMGLLLQTKMGNQYYYYSQILTCFVGGFVLLFIPLLLNLFLTYGTFLETGNKTYDGYYYSDGYCSSIMGTNVVIDTVSKGVPFLRLYIVSPFFYNFLYIIFISLFAGLISAFGLAYSYYIRKIKITLFAITYLLFTGGNRLNTFLFYSSNNYLNTTLLDYVSVTTMMGRLPLFFLSVCTILLVFTIISVYRISKKDQI